MDKICVEAELILNIAKSYINRPKDKPVKVIIEDSINWQLFKDLITYHEFQSLAYPFLKDNFVLIPADLIEFLKNNYYFSIIRSQNLWREFLRIAKAFKVRNVPILPIKGVAFMADIYYDSPLRIMTDIDVLVKESDLQDAKDIFNFLGYTQELGGLNEKYWLSKQCHITFLKKNDNKIVFLVDIHFALDFKRNRRMILPELWNRVKSIDLEGEKIDLLSPEDSMFSLALHQRRFGKTLCLKNVLDLAFILHKYKRNFSWEYVIDESKRSKLSSSLYFILFQTKLFFNVEIGDQHLKGLSVPFYKKILISNFVKEKSFANHLERNVKSLYLFCHFLLYDNLIEPVVYILTIPQEQFAKFYGLKSYEKRTYFLYKIRIPYIIFRSIFPVTKIKMADSFPPDLNLFEVSGYSMWPFLKEGSKVLIRKDQLEILRVGDIILHRLDQQFVCHRLIRKTEDLTGYKLYLRGDNSISLPYSLGEENYCGKVVAVLKNGRIFNYCTCWRSFLNKIIVFCAPLVCRLLKFIKLIYAGHRC